MRAQDPRGADFRDRLGIVSTEGKRNWIYPRQPHGRYYRARTIVSAILLIVLFGTPFLRFGGHPLMLLDVTERKFIVFGLVFGPHDFILFALAMITAIVFVFLFTVVAGRLFCGWLCPQTVFLEMVFRRIDYWIEGGPNEQRRLNASRWRVEKIFRKGVKHALYFVIAFCTANALLAWIVGSDKLSAIIIDSPSRHMGGLAAALLFAAAFHWIFAWFREQACILVCPYGRLQGVLLDRHSVVIMYDFIRGEPRGKMRKKEVRAKGDCIDCGMCVDVCPTGIDIRNGTQLECVNCTACVDACDGVMDSIGRPRGLIRWDSIEGIEKNVRSLMNSRSIGYSFLLLLLVTLLTYLVVTRTDVDVTLLRMPGMFFQEQPDGRISNLYDVSLLNKTFEAVPVAVRFVGENGTAIVLGGPLVAEPQKPLEFKVMVLLPNEQIARVSTPIRLRIETGDRVLEEVETTFLGPARKAGKP